jgi:hypothetical protein
MRKIDFKKELKHLYSASTKEAAIVDVPEMDFLMIDGAGHPNTGKEFQNAMEALYGVSYTLKFMIKKATVPADYVVLPPEGLWWTGDAGEFDVANADAWRWTLMIMQPEYVTGDLFAEAVEQVEEKKSPPALSKIRFETFHEGLSVQTMHIGPYGDEGPTIEKLHRFAKENGYGMAGKHHEIYLSDPRRTAPEKLKTVIRYPVK